MKFFIICLLFSFNVFAADRCENAVRAVYLTGQWSDLERRMKDPEVIERMKRVSSIYEENDLRVVEYILSRIDELKKEDLLGLLSPATKSSAEPQAVKGIDDLRRGDGFSYKFPEQKEEIDASLSLSRAGYRVVYVSEESTGWLNVLQKREGLNERKRPDLIVDDRIFDIYTPVTNKIVRSINHKVRERQTHRIALNLRSAFRQKKKLNELVSVLRENAVPGLWEVLAVIPAKEPGGAAAVRRIFP